MTHRFEWLDRPGAEPEPEQYVAIVNALGDWIEAQLDYRHSAERANARFNIRGLLQERIEELVATCRTRKADAKRRAIEAGYVWRLDLDP